MKWIDELEGKGKRNGYGRWISQDHQYLVQRFTTRNMEKVEPYYCLYDNRLISNTFRLGEFPDFSAIEKFIKEDL